MSKPKQLLDEAMTAVPFVKYALGVAGIAAAALICTSFFGLSLGKAFLAILGMMVPMVVLAVLARASGRSAALKTIAVFLIGAYCFLSISITTLLITSVFFAWPLNLTHWVQDQNYIPPTKPATGSGKIEKMNGVIVEPGSFNFGSREDDPYRERNEYPTREVEIDYPFWIKTTEVTQKEWAQLMGNLPSKFQQCGENCPVESVSWFDAIAWCNSRSEHEGLNKCYHLSACSSQPGGNDFYCEVVEFRGLHCEGYRLPTEFEWEYAARAGTEGMTYRGNFTETGKNSGTLISSLAWYGGNAGVDYDGAIDCSAWRDMEYPADRCGPHDVGLKEPNGLGLYDMLGSVHEWMQDRFVEDISLMPSLNPAVDRDERSLRGGGWDWDSRWIRIGNRHYKGWSSKSREIGFRPVRTIANQQVEG